MAADRRGSGRARPGRRGDRGRRARRAGDPGPARRSTSADRVAAALTQAELRRRAVPKFGDLAARMYFTPDGLEQATRLSVATHRAGRLQAADTRSAVDLGCGIGGELLAFGAGRDHGGRRRAGPVRVGVAQANLAALWLDGEILEADATDARPSPLRRGLRRPRTSGWPGSDVRRRRGGLPLALRRGAAAPRRVRQGRAGHPAPLGAGRRGGRVGQRPQRGEGAARGRAGWPRCATRDRDRRGWAGHADEEDDPGAGIGVGDFGASCTSRTLP